MLNIVLISSLVLRLLDVSVDLINTFRNIINLKNNMNWALDWLAISLVWMWTSLHSLCSMTNITAVTCWQNITSKMVRLSLLTSWNPASSYGDIGLPVPMFCSIEGFRGFFVSFLFFNLFVLVQMFVTFELHRGAASRHSCLTTNRVHVQFSAVVSLWVVSCYLYACMGLFTVLQFTPPSLKHSY